MRELLSADSEAVRLAPARSVLHHTVKLSEFAAIESRLSSIEAAIMPSRKNEMRLDKRLISLEKVWFSLEAEYYSRHWQELYEHDPKATELSDELEKLIEVAEAPFWFWPGEDSRKRQFGWAIQSNPRARLLFDEMFKKLRTLVDDRNSHKAPIPPA